MIEVKNLTKSYGSVGVLNSLSASITPGTITGLLGPNACGKTTLIKTILGLVVADSGEVLFDGKSIQGNFFYRELIGYMPQNPDFPAKLCPRELFTLLRSLRRRKSVGEAELIEQFGLGAFLKRPLGTLSAGTRQKVSAVAALMFEPSVLILDEPTAGLDPITSVVFRRLILEVIKKGVTVIFVSHIILELEQLASEILFLLDGKLLFSGEIAALRKKTETQSLEDGILRLLQQSSRAGASHAA